MATSTKRHPLTTSFEVPEGTHTVLVLAPHYWGRGATKAEAMAEVKRQGGEPSKYGYVAYYFGEGITDEVWVDQMGGVNWTYSPEVVAAVEGKTRAEARAAGLIPEPVKEEVGI